MTQLIRDLIKVAQSGWAVTARVTLLCLAVAAAVVTVSLIGLPRFM